MQIFTLLRSAGKTGAEIPPAPEKIKMKKTLEKSFRIQYNIVRCRKVRGNLISATVAQLVEQRIRNAQAVGSSPTSSSIKEQVRWLALFTLIKVKKPKGPNKFGK